MAIYDPNSTQHSDVSEQLEVVKPKRTRKRKELPSFSLMEKGDIPITQMNIRTNMMCQVGPEYENMDNMPICPYTEYIPLSYILTIPLSLDNPTFHIDYFNEKLKDRDKSLRDKIIKEKREVFTKLPSRIKCTMINDANDSIELLNSYLSFDNIIESRNTSGYENRLQGILDMFTGENAWTINSYFRTRSYNGYVGWMSLSRGLVPEIIAVILPENYIYMKLKLIKDGIIDLSKVVVLVNRELDSTSYPSAPFRAFYKKYIEPYLKTIACDVWKVPLEYIQEKCFLYNYKIEESNIIKRKERIAEFVESFIEKASGEGLSQRPDPEADIFEDSYIFRMPEVTITTTPTLTINAASSMLIYADSVEQTTYTAGVDPYRQQGEMESST